MRRALALAACLLLSSPGVAEEPTLREIFEETAAATSERYVLGRDVLLAAGDRAVELATEYRDDADAGRRALAQLIRVKTELPEQDTVWQAALRNPWIEVTSDAQSYPRALVRFRRTGSRGQTLETREVLFHPDAQWVVIDALREPQGTRSANAIRIAGAMRSAVAAPWIAASLDGRWDRAEQPPVVDALVAIGAPALPHVRPLLDDESSWSRTVASMVLEQLEDADSRDALLEVVGVERDAQAFAAAAAALRRIDARAGAAATLERLLQVATVGERRDSQDLRYEEARGVFRAFGDTASAALDEVRSEDDAAALGVITGLRWELSDAERARAAYARIGAAADPREASRTFGSPDEEETVHDVGYVVFWFLGGGREEAPVALLSERAAAYGEPQDLTHVLRTASAEHLQIAADLTKRRLLARAHAEYRPLLTALATAAPDAALDALDAAIRDDPPRFLPLQVESALLLLDHPRTAGVLARIVERAPDAPRSHSDRTYQDAARIAEPALAVTRGERELVSLLDHDDDTVRVTVARALARKGSAAAAPVLAAAALVTRAGDHVSLRDDLLRTGVVPEQIDVPDADRDLADMLRDDVRFRLAQPARAAEIEDALARAQPWNPSILGVQPADYVHAGASMAEQLDSDARPVLAGAAVFRGNLVAIHALGALGNESAIPALLRAARARPWHAARALRSLGPSGVKAAETVPPPDPAKADYGGRAARHVAAADALGDSPVAIEKILVGLAEPPPEDRHGRRDWARRIARYLSLANRDPASGSGMPPPPPHGIEPNADRPLDDRLLEPALQLLADHGRDHAEIRSSAFRVLAHFRDERVAVAALPYLPHERFDYDGDEALAALRGSLGDGVRAFLQGRLDAGAGDRRVLHTLWRLVQESTATPDERDACAAHLRAACSDENTATDLLLLHTKRPEDERDPADLAAVLDYVRTRATPGVVVYPLVEARPPGAAEALHESYRLGRDRRVLGGLSSLGYEPAAGDVHAEALRRLRETPDDRWRHHELQHLATLGERGRELARGFLTDRWPLATRAQAAASLGAVGDTASTDAIVTLLDEVEAVALVDDSDADLGPRKLAVGVRWAVAKLDPRRAHRLFVERALTGPELFRETYVQIVRMLRQRHPDVVGELPGTVGD